MIKHLFFILLVGYTSMISAAEPISVTKDFHSSFIDSISDFFNDEFYSSKVEIFTPSQIYNAIKGRGPGDLCYQMRYDRKNLSYKLPNDAMLNLSRKSYYEGNTFYRDCLVNEKFKCLRLYYVGNEFYCTDSSKKNGIRILDMNLNEKEPQQIKNCGLRPMIQKNKKKVFISVSANDVNKKDATYGQGNLPKVNIARTLQHGKCKIKIENKLFKQNEENIYNQSKSHIIGVAKIGNYKCHITGGDLDISSDISCDSITLTGEVVKCQQGKNYQYLRFVNTCFEKSGETILSDKDMAIQNSARKIQNKNIKIKKTKNIKLNKNK